MMMESEKIPVSPVAHAHLAPPKKMLTRYLVLPERPQWLPAA